MHLGNDRAGGQAFTSGEATAARVCSLVSMPAAADVHLQVVNVRMTETALGRPPASAPPSVPWGKNQ